jgi:hypothetical protein
VTSVLLFDACGPGDAALENSHWMAERTRERLGDAALTLTHPDAVRARLEALLRAPDLTGLAVFGHGEPGRLHTMLRTQHRDERRAAIDEASEAGAVYGSDAEPALDLRNIHLLRGRWCHALACNVGLSLAHRAREPGVACFVAYETSLTPEYEVDALPGALHDRLAVVVTTATLALHQGIHDEKALKARVQEAVLDLEAWLDCDEAEAWLADQEGYMHVAGLRGFAHQLVRDMVVLFAEP